MTAPLTCPHCGRPTTPPAPALALLDLADELRATADAASFTAATYSDGLREAAHRIRQLIGSNP